MSPTVLIRKRLAAAARRHQKEAGGGFWLRSLKWLLLVVVALAVLDVLGHLSAGWRLGLGLALLGGALALTIGSAWMVVRGKTRLEAIARILEARDSRLGSKLINLLQLESQTRDPALPPL